MSAYLLECDCTDRTGVQAGRAHWQRSVGGHRRANCVSFQTVTNQVRPRCTRQNVVHAYSLAFIPAHPWSFWFAHSVAFPYSITSSRACPANTHFRNATTCHLYRWQLYDSVWRQPPDGEWWELETNENKTSNYVSGALTLHHCYNPFKITSSTATGTRVNLHARQATVTDGGPSCKCSVRLSGHWLLLLQSVR